MELFADINYLNIFK